MLPVYQTHPQSTNRFIAISTVSLPFLSPMDTEIWVTVHCSLRSGGHSQPGKWRTSHISLPVKLWQEAKWPGPQSNPMHLWAIGKWMPFFPLPPSEDSLSHQSFSAHLHGPKWLFPPALGSYWYWIPGPISCWKVFFPSNTNWLLSLAMRANIPE